MSKERKPTAKETKRKVGRRKRAVECPEPKPTLEETHEWQTAPEQNPNDSPSGNPQ